MLYYSIITKMYKAGESERKIQMISIELEKLLFNLSHAQYIVLLDFAGWYRALSTQV